MLIQDAQKYGITYKGLVNKFDIYVKEKDDKKTFIILFHKPYTYIVFLDEELQSVNCYCQELDEFIKPYELLLLNASTLNPEDFKKIVFNLNKKQLGEYKFSQAISRQEAKAMILSLYEYKHPNYSESINSIIDKDFSGTTLKIPLFNYKKDLTIKRLTNIVCFSNKGYWYQFKNITGFRIIPDDFKQLSTYSIDVYCNPNLFLNLVDESHINILSNNQEFFLDQLKRLYLSNYQFNLFYNINSSKDLYFVLIFIINYYNYFINNYFIYINRKFNSGISLYFYTDKISFDSDISEFYTKLSQRYFPNFFSIDPNIDNLNNYIYQTFNFQFTSNKYQSCHVYQISMFDKKQLLMIFIDAFRNEFLNNANFSLYPYFYNQSNDTFTLIK